MDALYAEPRWNVTTPVVANIFPFTFDSTALPRFAFSDETGRVVLGMLFKAF
jgi:hypothetical protein